VKQQFWSKQILDLVPYTPGEQPKVSNLIKLNTNENPYPPTPKINHLLSHFDIAQLSKYPDPESSKLRATIAEYNNVAAENVFIGNGSDEVLAHAFMAFFRQDKPILMPDISYSFYTVYCDLYNIEATAVPIQSDFSVSLDQYNIENGGIIFANPNAPTGHTISLAEIETLLQSNTQSLVIVDEAYVDFGADSAVELSKQYANCLVIQTLSKSRSLAGLRIGFAIGNKNLIEALERVKNSFNSYPLDSLAQVCAQAAFEDEEYFKETIEKTVTTRQWTTLELQRLDFKVIPSKTNFLFVEHTSQKAVDIMQDLREHNIIVRHFTKDRISNYLRISIGTDQQMEQMIARLKTYLSA
jgi:histidinol-phosphate aminotransferase